MVRGDDVAAVEQGADAGRDLDLPGLAAQPMDAVVERGAAALQGVDRHCPGNDRGVEHALAEEQGVKRDRGRGLGAVDQRQPFLGREHERIAAESRKRGGGGHDRSAKVDAAFAHQGRDHVRERGEVARGADAALRRNHGHGVSIEQRHQRVNHFAPHARMAATEPDQLERDHQPDGAARERVAKPAAVAEDQIALKVGELRRGDARLGEQSETGVDAIDGLARGDDAFDRAGGGVDRGQCIIGQTRTRAAPQLAKLG